MPIYQYRCKECSREKSILRPMSERDSSVSCDCGAEMKRAISRTSFALKGSGWAKDGYSSKK